MREEAYCHARPNTIRKNHDFFLFFFFFSFHSLAPSLGSNSIIYMNLYLTWLFSSLAPLPSHLHIGMHAFADEKVQYSTIQYNTVLQVYIYLITFHLFYTLPRPFVRIIATSTTNTRVRIVLYRIGGCGVVSCVRCTVVVTSISLVLPLSLLAY